MTEDGDQVADQDANDDEDQGKARVMSKNLLQLEEPREIHVGPIGSLLT